MKNLKFHLLGFEVTQQRHKKTVFKGVNASLKFQFPYVTQFCLFCVLTDVKGLFTRNVFYPASVILFTDIRITDRIMGPLPILPVIHIVIIGTMLNNNGGKSGHGLKKR